MSKQSNKRPKEDKPSKRNSTSDLFTFLLELDALKVVERKSWVPNSDRLENSAEHSWHLAMACWVIAEHFDLEVNMEQLLKLALIHDLGEIDAGDTFLYAQERNTAAITEREGISRLAAEPGNSIKNLQELWEEQETGKSPETKLLKVVDRLLPFMLNFTNEGKTWRQFSIKRSQVFASHCFIQHEIPELWEWISERLDHATEQGWLIDD